MHPFILHANWLAEQVDDNSMGVDVTLESRDVVVNHLTANESVNSLARENHLTDEGCDDPDMDYLPKPRFVPGTRSKAQGIPSRVSPPTRPSY